MERTNRDTVRGCDRGRREVRVIEVVLDVPMHRCTDVPMYRCTDAPAVATKPAQAWQGLPGQTPKCPSKPGMRSPNLYPRADPVRRFPATQPQRQSPQNGHPRTVLARQRTTGLTHHDQPACSTSRPAERLVTSWPAGVATSGMPTGDTGRSRSAARFPTRRHIHAAPDVALSDEPPFRHVTDIGASQPLLVQSRNGPEAGP